MKKKWECKEHNQNEWCCTKDAGTYIHFKRGGLDSLPVVITNGPLVVNKVAHTGKQPEMTIRYIPPKS